MSTTTKALTRCAPCLGEHEVKVTGNHCGVEVVLGERPSNGSDAHLREIESDIVLDGGVRSIALQEDEVERHIVA